MKRRFRVMVRPSVSAVAGRAIGYGIRVGYWPCLKAPFFSVSFHKWHIDLWHGLPSYVQGDK
jgi:hypothetical protein